MSFNVTSYLIYIPITVLITVIIGKLFHRNGTCYTLHLISDPSIARSVNNLLLTGYYLFNAGYAIVMIRKWPQVQDFTTCMNELSARVGFIVFTLAVMHYFNMLVIGWVYHHRKQSKNHTSWKIT